MANYWSDQFGRLRDAELSAASAVSSDISSKNRLGWQRVEPPEESKVNQKVDQFFM
jgi:hypothetical protein